MTANTVAQKQIMTWIMETKTCIYIFIFLYCILLAVAEIYLQNVKLVIYQFLLPCTFIA